MKANLVLLATLFVANLPTLSCASDKPLLERPVMGLDAKLISDALAESGIKKEEVAARGVPTDHDLTKIPTRTVYRVESVVCKEKKCTPFTVDAARMKKLDSIFHKLGVEVTPAPKGKKNGKAILFMKEVLCEVPANEKAVIACYVTAHFNSKK